MGSWSYPDASLEDLVIMVKGFIDMTILASGYQSSGRLAHWDSQNIKNALQLALFLEHLMRDLSSSDDYRDSLEELDAALCGMISNPYFPQGLAHFSSKVLCKASEFMLEHLISVFPLRDEHLKALLTANVEMDYHMHPKTDSRSLNEIFETLMCPFSLFTAQALERRQKSVSLISSAETGLDILSSGLRDLYVREDDDALTQKMKSFLVNAPRTEERRIGSAVWNSWKSRSLSYLLDKRTIRLVSGASLLFSAPKSQWIQVFQRMDISSQLEDSLCEIVWLWWIMVDYGHLIGQDQVRKRGWDRDRVWGEAVGVQEEFEGHVEGGYGYGARGNGPRDQGGCGGHDMGLNSIKVTRPSFQRGSDLDGYFKRESQCDRIFQANDLPDVKKKTYAITQFEGYALTWRE
ncbi:hypothetical protein CQW23_30141 [Capsicum baccatum]|uniref:Uncharacterized protein n=1 Tax=Capsicum baccatum TaxID=33114 RepID=A0A2G2VB94_CAPBA|nr:hypothetical protein CQW23_30141 [Capsicum baccatum]